MYSVRVLLSIFLLFSITVGIHSAKILSVFPVAGKSHHILAEAFMKELANRGHDVTLISPYEDKSYVPKNGSYKQVVLTGFVEEMKGRMKMALEFVNKPFPFVLLMMSLVGTELSNKTMYHPNVQELLNSNETFDAVIVEQFMNDATKYLAYHYKAPLIVFNAMGPNPWINRLVGNPAPPSFVAEFMLGFPNKMTFVERTINTMYNVFSQVVDNFMRTRNQRNVVKQLDPEADYEAIVHNISIVLLNSHTSLASAVPMVPNMIEIGGFHVKKPKTLPKDLQDYLDNSKNGVVYFSMGSNVQSKDLPEHKREALLKVFASLKENVLWKWEDDSLPNQPSNVKLAKWLPQQDVLAHPNVKLFVTHGGMLSTIETVYHGVPILAIPVYGDQHINARSAVVDGYCVTVPFTQLSEETFSQAMQELLSNPKYSENAKLRSKLMHDRPMSPMDTAVYWTEYVIRNGGAPHLRVAAVDLKWYQYLLLDVLAVIIIVPIGIVVVFKKLCQFIKCKTTKVKTN